MGISVEPVPLLNGRVSMPPILTDGIRKYLQPLEVPSDSARTHPKQDGNWGSLDLKRSTFVTFSMDKHENGTTQDVIAENGSALGVFEGPHDGHLLHESEKSFVSQSLSGKLKTEADSSDEELEDDLDEDAWTYPEDSISSYGVDPRDEGTSDKWVRRHPEMVRLTGRHPFNSEAPLSRLMEHGFLTPTSIHYVRNHGYVPQAIFDEWTVEVSGFIKRPQIFNMRQIVQEFKPRELPVTLVCAGNRRKEQNMVKQTIGFNWGAAGVSTSVWRGARLCDVLRRCGVMSKRKGALYVCFEGQETLPGGGGSKYGTSISVEVAMDEAREVLLAYKQNGKLLEPDHGFPVRMIIPGCIGGRMVKWLTRIIVTSKESDNYYHYKDNRVLPSHVDAEKSNAENWWYKPDYIINELNVNSVISTPAHNEVVPMNAAALEKPYKMKGYAYSGGGRKVIRVEVTIDDGKSWRFCTVNHPEKPTKHGKYWCWCFWELEVEMMELLQAKELAVRAWDAAMNTQPQHLTWNVMGMMNNCWFRVKISPCKPKEGGIGLIFEHPIRPGNQTGGWMVPKDVSKAPPPEKPTLHKSISSPFLNRAVRQITTAELKKHSTADSPWIMVRDNIYDCTRFLKDHPGGSDSILINAGTDCTEEFDAIHSAKAQAMLEDFKIGELASFGSLSADNTPESSLHGGNRAASALQSLSSISELSPALCVALNPRKKITVTLTEKKILSQDVRVFRFALPNKDLVLGLPVGKHIFLSASVSGKLCMRAYTPVSSEDDVGYLDLLVKVYFKGVNPAFPAGGLMSQHLESLMIGATIEVKGPVGHIEYQGKGHFIVEGKAIFMRRCAMLAGGTGITPMYQVIRSILKDPEDKTEVYLVFANRTEADIMLREELDEWARKHSNFHVWYVLSSPPSADRAWAFSTGYIREEILREHLPAGSSSFSSSHATGVSGVDDRKHGGGAAALACALGDETAIAADDTKRRGSDDEEQKKGDHEEEEEEGGKTVAFLCGPPPMIELACLPNLEKLGYDRNLCFVF